MKTNSKQMLLLLIFALCIKSMAAQEKEWTLDECIQYAMKNNIQVKQQILLTNYQENNLLQARLDLLPDVNAGLNKGFNYGRTVETTSEYVDTDIQSMNYYIGASFTLFNGFQQLNTIARNKYNFLAVSKDSEKMKNDIMLNIATAYLQILFNEELLETSKKQLITTIEQVDVTQKLVEAGSLARGSLLEIQAQQASEELLVINAENQLREAKLLLTQMLDLKSDADFNIVSPEIDLSAEALNFPLLSEVYTKAVQMPEIQSAEYKLNSSEKSLDIARGYYSPRLSLSINYGSSYSDARKIMNITGNVPQTIGYVEGTNLPVLSLMPQYETLNYSMNDQFRDNANTSITFGLSIPIFNGWQAKTAVSNAKIDIENSNYNLELAKNTLYKEIQQSHSNAVSALAKYSGNKKALEAMSESFKYTQQKFDLGIVNSLDYNTSKTKLAKTESDLLQAKYEFIFAVNVLRFYMGENFRI